MEAAEDRPAGTATEFPVYRQLRDGRHYYRIEGPEAFTELQRVGARVVVHRVAAMAYPEKLRIADMLSGSDGRFLPLEVEEWQRLFDLI